MASVSAPSEGRGIGILLRRQLPSRVWLLAVKRSRSRSVRPELLELPAEQRADEHHLAAADAPDIQSRPRGVPLADVEGEERLPTRREEPDARGVGAEAVVGRLGGVRIDG